MKCTHNKRNKISLTSLNVRGVDAGQWLYIVALVLGLAAIVFFAWILIQSQASNRGIFDMLENILGF